MRAYICFCETCMRKTKPYGLNIPANKSMKFSPKIAHLNIILTVLNQKCLQNCMVETFCH